MEHTSKNKLLTWLVVILLLANTASIAVFWLGKEKQPTMQPERGTPAEFLIRELKLDTKQQAQLEILRAQHRDAAVVLRQQLRVAKEAMFDLVKQENNINDSMQLRAAKTVSEVTEKLDLLALNHFIKVRAICTSEQQLKFDKIIGEVTDMIGKAGEPPPGKENRPPPHNEDEADRPPYEGPDNKKPPLQN
jgi:hypothetical protein